MDYYSIPALVDKNGALKDIRLFGHNFIQSKKENGDKEVFVLLFNSEIHHRKNVYAMKCINKEGETIIPHETYADSPNEARYNAIGLFGEDKVNRYFKFVKGYIHFEEYEND